jgi:hypothetical protein
MNTRMFAHQSASDGVNSQSGASADDFWLKLLCGAILSLLAGLSVLWLYLTIIGFRRLGGIADAFLQLPGITLVLASWLAVVLCIVGIPLMLPWFIVLSTIEFFLPRRSVLWRWWILTPLGMAAGIIALWSDAIAYSLLSSGSLHNINIPLLEYASAPAAILAGTACLTAALSASWFKISSSR